MWKERGGVHKLKIWNQTSIRSHGSNIPTTDEYGQGEMSQVGSFTPPPHLPRSLGENLFFKNVSNVSKK